MENVDELRHKASMVKVLLASHSKELTNLEIKLAVLRDAHANIV